MSIADDIIAIQDKLITILDDLSGINGIVLEQELMDTLGLAHAL